ncbi:hypothetical protein BDZ97DRAFT_119471 [Flammula alnicola]|nr:hypothetical protein BDZ97DRAFT_119471 [Flammula alnicola]
MSGPHTGSSEHSSAGYGSAGAAGLGLAAGAAGAGALYNPRSAKEIEAMGTRNQPHVMNPDETQGQGSTSQSPYPGDQARQAYLQYGPGGMTSSSSSSPAPGQGGSVPEALQPGRSTSPSSVAAAHEGGVRAGSAVIVHQDGGRVVMRKGEEAVDEEQEEQLPEIPPTYDSLVQAQQARGQQ